MKKFLEKVKSFLERLSLLPRFGEDTVFLMAASVALILVIDESARDFALQVKENSTRGTLVLLVGMAFAIYTAFFSYFKNEIQKFYMLWFAILVNFLSAFAVIQILSESGASNLYYLAPALNIAIAVVMAVLWYANLLDTSALPHRSSSYSNIIYGSLAVALFVFSADRVFGLAWPVVLSISVGYSSLFTQTVGGWLPRILPSRDKKISAMDNVLQKALERALSEYGKGNLSAIVIATEADVKVSLFPDEAQDSSDNFIQEQIRQLDRTQSAVAVASIGVYTSKRFWFSSEKTEPAIILEVYPNGGSKAYQFCQVIEWNDDVLQKVKGLMYLTKINNVLA